MKHAWLEREYSLIGEEAVDKLTKASVIIFGCGGVGGYTIEALARAGIGKLIVVDNDSVNESNINRQIIATRKTIGQLKTEAVADRIADINPDCKVEKFSVFADTQSSPCWTPFPAAPRSNTSAPVMNPSHPPLLTAMPE